MSKPIKYYFLNDLDQVVAKAGQPAFRSKQLAQWLYQKHATSYDDMTNLPKAFREKLANEYPLWVPRELDKQVSIDGTRKYVLQYPDETIVETVGIPSNDGRLTVCCSSQAGCAMGCVFCATGKEGFKRNLYPGEIVDQIFHVQEDFSKRVTNIVMMGQGEPFANYSHALESMRICNNQNLLDIGSRRITISTCGVLRGIERFENEPEQFTLAVSLHSAIQKKRNYLMPAMKQFNLNELRAVLEHYIDRTNRRVTFEYALINEVNDSNEDLDALIKYCRGMLCHVNLIALNRIPDSEFGPSSNARTQYWLNALNKAGVNTTLRHSHGADIAGACGQLANSFLR